jgi:hypothetical protein
MPMYKIIIKGVMMTYDECIKSNDIKAKRVREILNKIKKVKCPADLIMFKIKQKLRG